MKPNQPAEPGYWISVSNSHRSNIPTWREANRLARAHVKATGESVQTGPNHMPGDFSKRRSYFMHRGKVVFDLY